MAIEIVPVLHCGRKTFAGVNLETGKLNIPFSQFMIWFSMGKVVRKGAKSRAPFPTSKSNREYAYRLKRWFDFIDDWNESANEDHHIAWDTVQKKHLVFFLSKLKALSPNTRNGLREIWSVFYEEFCPFMGYDNLMRDLSQSVIDDNRYGSETLLGGNRKVVRRKSTLKEPAREELTFRVASLEKIGILLRAFDDPVFNHFSYFMFTTGLRIGGALQVPYSPLIDPKNEYITSPELIRSDYGIEDFFPFYYIYKGHEHMGDYSNCDVPLAAWEDIWNNYRPLQTLRLQLWRETKIKNTGDMSFSKRYPQSFWLDQKGKEITADDVWKAFRAARVKIEDNSAKAFPKIVPQMLRHSYATWMVVCYAEAEKIQLDCNDESMLETIHGYLQEQLGHMQRRTTLKYIKTAVRVVKKRWLPKIMPRRLPDGRIVAGMSVEQVNSFKTVIDFDGFMLGLNAELQQKRRI